ncbi:LemA family protein [Eubacterium limosum]|uniref:LemA family protein n=1 Tax=Eubacterium limosum TaxID=1736 RepID=UPI0010639697|nr:LemA family protein [Eubacterium limosum]
MIAIIIIIAIIVILALVVMGSYNSLVKTKNQAEEAFSTMDVYMKKRYDLIPNLVETVKGYASHESQTLEKVTAARNAAMTASSIDEKLKNENALTGTLKSLFAVAESYPDLKANTNFMDLQRQLQTIEEDIANSRKYYNASVKNLNNKIEMFPSSIIAGMFHFEKKPYFEVSSQEERENVKVQF